MPPLIANFAIRLIREVFEAHGIRPLEEFPDGQILWGDQPLADPYTGSFHMADYYVAQGRYDIFTVRAIVNNLGKGDELPAIENALFDRINEE